MKKNFEQPELMVVRISNNDVIATSLGYNSTAVTSADAADRFRDFEDYSF